jgi:hypothetical protein
MGPNPSSTTRSGLPSDDKTIPDGMFPMLGIVGKADSTPQGRRQLHPSILQFPGAFPGVEFLNLSHIGKHSKITPFPADFD